jgi:8-oxo-dGTP pyrophosphatase MutT (NUDIX family)
MVPERPSPEEIRRRALEDKPSFDPGELKTDEPITPRPASTVIVARDGDRGIDVFMLERHLKSDFAGGAYVFPGGTVDDRDCDPALIDLIDGLPPDAATLLDDEPERAHGYLVCAIRETFEEAGILLARDADGKPIQLADEPRFVDARHALAAGEMTPLQFATQERIRFAADLLGYFQRWITPEFAPRRYDARFFVALMPENQTPIHDDVETTASTWIRPADALQQAKSGLFSIIFPTRKTLEKVAQFGSARELLAAARVEAPTPVLPRVVERDGQWRVMLPGDPTEHDP